MFLDEAVALGPILPLDLPMLYTWEDDPAIARFNRPYLPADFQRQSDFWLNTSGDRGRVFFAIRARGGPEIIGYVQINAIEPIHRSASLGILIGRPDDRGKGYGRQAMTMAIDYCWNHLNLTRLTLRVQADNGRAIALYRQLGFETEGVLRKAEFIGGQWVDMMLMALMKAQR